MEERRREALFWKLYKRRVNHQENHGVKTMVFCYFTENPLNLPVDMDKRQ